MTLVVFVCLFRDEIKAWVMRSKFPSNGSAEIPGLGRYTWGAAADRVSDDAIDALTAAVDGVQLESTLGESAGRRQAVLEDAVVNEPLPLKLPSQWALRLAAGYRNWKELRALAVENPVAGVLDAWRTVSYKVYEQAYSEKASGFTEDWESSVAVAALRLGASVQVAAVLADLKELRDRAEAGELITRNDALEYIHAAETVLRAWSGSPFHGGPSVDDEIGIA